MIDGRVVIEASQLKTVDLPRVVEKHNSISRAMIARV
jgi:hypothetical protein